MTGVCGVVGSSGDDIGWMMDDLRWTGREENSAFIGEEIGVGSVHHDSTEREQPATLDDEVFVWVAGDVWGYDGPGGYRRRRDEPGTIAQFCARLYAEQGIDFVEGLNGTFAAVVYDQRAETVHIVTDRLATHSVYVARPDDGTLVFSTQIQSLPLHPLVDAEFDVESLCEYFAYGVVKGVKTPFDGVEELQPSSVTTVDLATGSVDSERYWRPEYDPVDKPFSYFVDRFVDAFEAALEDRIDPDTTYGLLLSGGSDSRAILAGVDEDVDLCAYHTTGWLSREARTAERVAFAADRELRLLKRDRDSHARMLESTPAMMNFTGVFNEAHIAEHVGQVSEEVDVLISGHGADTLFRNHAFPRPSVDLGPIGRFNLPLIEDTESVADFVERRDRPTPSYLDSPYEPREVLERNIRVGNGGVSHHGVDYRSLEELVFFDDFYPMSNKSDFFYGALNNMVPHWSPFFDNRLVDLALQLPEKYRTRRNIIDATTMALDERLGEIPHAETGVSLSESFPMSYVKRLTNKFVWKHLSSDQPPRAQLTHGPWTNKRTLIRTHEFVGETLREKADLIDSLPFLDRDGVARCYGEHLHGADNTYELYTLLSFLEMPVVEQMATNRSDTARLPEEPSGRPVLRPSSSGGSPS
jgi:asparagine synthase (glutamine-hydrolysing)